MFNSSDPFLCFASTVGSEVCRQCLVPSCIYLSWASGVALYRVESNRIYPGPPSRASIPKSDCFRRRSPGFIGDSRSRLHWIYSYDNRHVLSTLPVLLYYGTAVYLGLLRGDQARYTIRICVFYKYTNFGVYKECLGEHPTRTQQRGKMRIP